MVTAELIDNEGPKYRYHYYPEDNREFRPGIIEIDVVAELVVVTCVAEKDFEIYESVEECNAFIERHNQLLASMGETDFLPPATRGSKRYPYGNHEISAIIKEIKDGQPPQKAKSIWY